MAIERGVSGLFADNDSEEFAPEYEISFHEAREKVIAAAEKEGRWPFRIDIGDAKELFLVVTDAGDGNRGEYAIWRRGRIVFADGSANPWEKAIVLKGTNSGREFPFGVDGEGSANLPADMRMMLDLILLAWRMDKTRVVTLIFNRDVSHMKFGFLDGVLNDQLHGISHHKNNLDKVASYQKINQFHTEQFAYLLEQRCLSTVIRRA